MDRNPLSMKEIDGEWLDGFKLIECNNSSNKHTLQRKIYSLVLFPLNAMTLQDIDYHNSPQTSSLCENAFLGKIMKWFSVAFYTGSSSYSGSYTRLEMSIFSDN